MKKRGFSNKILITFAVLTVVFFLGLYSPSHLLPFSVEVGFTQPTPPKAAIVDQGSLAPTSGPNPVFVKKATAILKEAGFSVDYYPGEEVTVKFYRNLPTYGYDLIIERTHSDMHYPESNISASASNSPKKGYLCIFTNEPLDRTKVKKHLFDVKNKRLIGCGYKKGDKKRGDLYFGITPTFVTQSMRGKFDGTTVIMMGCEGLKNNSMAKAYIQKGCKAYTSWNGPVSSDHADKATISLLQHLLLEKLPIKEAVVETMRKVGSGTTYKSVLLFYPIYAKELQSLIDTYKSIGIQIKYDPP